jgi:SnoaL-like domain
MSDSDALCELRRQIARLEAIEEIRDLKWRYARCSDDRDAQALAHLFTVDGVFDGGAELGRHHGRAAIASFIADTLNRLEWAAHYMTNGSIEISPSGEEATGLWRLWEPSTVAGEATWIIGSYRDEYQRVEGTWLFSLSQLRFDAIAPVRSDWTAGPLTRI